MKRLSGWFDRKHGGDLVSEGVYWNLRSLKLLMIRGVIDFLPGQQEVSYLHLPIPVVPVVALALSLIYVLALSLAPIFFLGLLGSHGVNAAFRQFKTWRCAEIWN